jgi:hypothetical protein
MLVSGMLVQGAAGDARASGLGAELILGALVDDLAVVHVQFAWAHSVPARDGLHVEMLDPVEVGQCKGESFSLFGCNKVIDVDGVDRLITCLIATTVAQWFPASRETGQKDVSHHCHLCRTTDAVLTGIPHERCGRSPRKRMGGSAPRPCRHAIIACPLPFMPLLSGTSHATPAPSPAPC